MAVIPGITASDTVQIIVIVAVGVGVLFIFVGVLVCCCSRKSNDEEEIRRLKKLTQQKAKYAPSADANTPFFVLCIVVRSWSALLAADRLHAYGADLRLKQLVAKLAPQHGAYYIDEGDNLEQTANRKYVIAKSPDALYEMVVELVTTVAFADFCSNVDGNRLLREVYGGERVLTPWSGLQLLTSLHYGTGSISSVDDAQIVAAGPVLDESKFLAEAADLHNGICVISGSFVGKVTSKNLGLTLGQLEVDEAVARVGQHLDSSCMPLRRLHILSNKQPALINGTYSIAMSTTPMPSTTPTMTGSRNDDELRRVEERRRAHLQQADVAVVAAPPGSGLPQQVDDIEDVDI